VILQEWMDLVEANWKGAKFAHVEDAVVATILFGQLEVGCWCESGCEVLDPTTPYVAVANAA
jgi:hypothetical protein